MPTVELFTPIAAPPERCFDLARSIDLHVHSQRSTGELAVAGVTSGLVGPGERVTWQATHLGVRQRLTVEITAFDRPRHFRDSMVSGAFRRFDHDHWFERTAEGETVMRDVFEFESPMGVLGRLADRAFLTRYMRELLVGRCADVKQAAESDLWRRFLAPEPPAR